MEWITLYCGCTAEVTGHVSVRIDYCPLHKAAPKLLAALEEVTQAFHDNEHVKEDCGHPVCTLGRQAIKEARGAIDLTP